MRTLESHAIVFTKDLTRERFDQGSKEELARVSMYCRKVLVACSRPRRAATTQNRRAACGDTSGLSRERLEQACDSRRFSLCHPIPPKIYQSKHQSKRVMIRR